MHHIETKRSKTMTYKLFIDDERHPVTNDWVIARSSKEAIKCVQENGLPDEVAFDHDLGGDDTVRSFIFGFVDYIIDNRLVIPKSFKYSVHSQNPVGAEWIRGTMSTIIEEFGE
jgi:hypothetical protein